MHPDPYPYPPPPWPRQRRGGGTVALVAVTALSLLAAPHARALRPTVDQLRQGTLPMIRLPGGFPAVRLPHLAAPSQGRAPGRVPSGLSFTDAAGCRPARDWGSPHLDRRIRRLLTAAAARWRIRVSCLRTGHSYYVVGTRRVSNHTVWRGVDIDLVDGRSVSSSDTAARQLVVWIGQGGGGVHPSEVGSPWRLGGRPWFTDPGHRDHLHIGFAGPTQAGAR